MVPGDQADGAEGPDVDEDHPEGGAEIGAVLVADAHPDGPPGDPAAAVDQEGRKDVLYPCAGVGPGDPDQQLQAVGGQRHRHGGHQRQEGEDAAAGAPGVHATLGQEERSQVVPEGDGDDGKVGRQGEDGKEAEEVVDGGQVPLLAFEVEK